MMHGSTNIKEYDSSQSVMLYVWVYQNRLVGNHVLMSKIKTQNEIRTFGILNLCTRPNSIFENKTPRQGGAANIVFCYKNGTMNKSKRFSTPCAVAAILQISVISSVTHHHHHLCHGVGPLVDPFRSHVSRSLFKGLP